VNVRGNSDYRSGEHSKIRSVLDVWRRCGSNGIFHPAIKGVGEERSRSANFDEADLKGLFDAAAKNQAENLGENASDSRAVGRLSGAECSRTGTRGAGDGSFPDRTDTATGCAVLRHLSTTGTPTVSPAAGQKPS